MRALASFSLLMMAAIIFHTRIRFDFSFFSPLRLLPVSIFNDDTLLITLRRR